MRPQVNRIDPNDNVQHLLAPWANQLMKIILPDNLYFSALCLARDESTGGQMKFDCKPTEVSCKANGLNPDSVLSHSVLRSLFRKRDIVTQVIFRVL